MPGIGPDEFKFSLDEGGIIGDKVDFGRTEVVTTVDKNNNDSLVLDCFYPENRGSIYKTAKIVNISDQPLEITPLRESTPMPISAIRVVREVLNFPTLT